LDNVLELKNIYKSFGGTQALSDISFDLKPGEVHALIGENGAGKSTMIKIMTGVHQPDSGDIILKNKIVKFKNASVSYDNKIAAIYQEASLFPELTVAENIFMGHHEVSKFTKTIKWGNVFKESQKIIKQLELELDPRRLVKTLGIAEKQIVEIIKALSANSEILIMDEPTSALTSEEVDDLFKIIKNLKKSGTAIIYISHRMEEIFNIADRVTVIRDGKIIDTKKVEEVDEKDLVKMMVGKDLGNYFPRDNVEIGDTILKVENLLRFGEFKDISFDLKEGEILGISGLVGAGRTEIVRTIFGVEKLEGGSIYVFGKKVKINNPVDALNLGIAYLSESRGEYGLVLGLSILQNITLAILNKISSRGWLNKKKENEIAKKYFDLLKIKANSLNQNVGSLSGGNQQKVALAKWLAANAKILILDEPTRGVDIGTKTAVHALMNDLTKEKIGIIMISSELPEIMGMSDRIIVIYEGKVIKEFKREEATKEKVISASVGYMGNYDD